jgi:hypothetical protein
MNRLPGGGANAGTIKAVVEYEARRHAWGTGDDMNLARPCRDRGDRRHYSTTIEGAKQAITSILPSLPSGSDLPAIMEKRLAEKTVMD